MADITWPFTDGDARFAPEAFDETLEFDVVISTSRAGRVTTQALPGARWRLVMNHGDTTVAYLQQRRQLEAFYASLKGGANRLLLHNMLTPAPLGTMRGAPVLAADVAAGASTAVLTNCTAGANVLGGLLVYQQWVDAWVGTNATISYNSTAAPLAGQLATTVTRTASGDCFIRRTFTLASSQRRSVRFKVWLKLGTLTGNVRIIVSDGALGNSTTKIVTATATWQEFEVIGYIAAGAAANIVVFVQPDNTVGSAGQTFFVWFSEVRVEPHVLTNATIKPGAETGPSGSTTLASHLVRLATGDHICNRRSTRAVAIGEVWTYSVWLRAGTLTGDVGIQVIDETGAAVAQVAVTPTSTWQRFSITCTFSSVATVVGGSINPVNNTGSAGDTLAFWGEQLEPGPVATDHFPATTLLSGDRIAIGGQRVMLLADAPADLTGQAAISFQPALRAAALTGAAVTLVKPTTRYVATQPMVPMPARGSVLPGFSMEFVEE